MAKRLRSYGDDLGSGSRDRELDRSLSAAAAGSSSSSSSSFQYRRWNPEENSRYRDISWAGARRRTERDANCFDREGSRGFRKTSDHDFANEFDDPEVWRSSRNRIDRDVDGFEDGEGSRGPRNRIDHDWSDNFDHREGCKGLRRRFENETEEFDRRQGFNRFRDRGGNNRGGRGMVWERNRYRGRGRETIHRPGNFRAPRGSFPKGFRSQRDRSNVQGTVSSWKRFDTTSREVEDELKTSARPDGDSSSRESLRSLHKSEGAKSPSKDVETSEGIVGRNGGNDIVGEMEEGDLQLDCFKEAGIPAGLRKEVDNLAEIDQNVMHLDLPEEAHIRGCKENSESAGVVKSSNREKVGDSNEPDAGEIEPLREPEDVEAENAPLQGKLSSSESNFADRACGTEVREDVKAANIGDKSAISESLRDDHPDCPVPANDELACRAREEVDVGNDTVAIQSGEDEMENAIDVGVVAEDVMDPQLTKDIAEANLCESELSMDNGKDKGKGVDISSSNEVEFSRKDCLLEQNFIASRNNSSESPSNRGFELFSCSNVGKVDEGHKGSHNKDQDEKRTREPLELSLCLPNVSVPALSNSVAPRQSSPPCTRSVQSLATTLCTGSDGFTRSISFSGSQFIHNPSCSLTHNSIEHDYKQSVKSRPLFQGVDWQALAANDSLPKELPTYQKVPSYVNGSLHLPTSEGILNDQVVCGNPTVLNRSGSLQRQQPGMKMTYHDENDVPFQGSRFDHAKESGQATVEESGCTIQENVEQVAILESDFINSIVGFVVSEPIQAIAYKFTEMADESIACLKEGIQQVILKENNEEQLYSFQGVLNNRSDLTLETLLKCHRVQLEILVAIKTGVAGFIQHGQSVSLRDLAEIFLNSKCRNPNCGSELPADDCECKFCSRKDGFCNMCMCLVCSKFDTASNTCGWIGCDSCSHWCHANCGVHKSYIRNGQSVSSAQGTSEMQFYCVACDHPSEMFGFVKDVFQTCAAEWTAETMIRELEYVERIFSMSKDTRGKSLHDTASQALVQLKAASNLPKVCITDNLLEIFNRIMRFFKDSGSVLGSASASSVQEQQTPMRRETPITAPSKNSFPANNADNSSSISDFDQIQLEGSGGIKEPRPVVDELETLVKITQEEAKVFQFHADNARRKAEFLKHIANSKSQQMDEVYTARIAKLQVSLLEENRRKKLEELRVLEISYQEYMKTRTRMQEDIKELCLTMGNAKPNSFSE